MKGNLERLAIGLETGTIPPDVAAWLKWGIERYLADEHHMTLCEALNIRHKNGGRRRQAIKQRDNEIRFLCFILGSPKAVSELLSAAPARHRRRNSTPPHPGDRAAAMQPVAMSLLHHCAQHGLAVPGERRIAQIAATSPD